jgi:hypothetical protein
MMGSIQMADFVPLGASPREAYLLQPNRSMDAQVNAKIPWSGRDHIELVPKLSHGRANGMDDFVPLAVQVNVKIPGQLNRSRPDHIEPIPNQIEPVVDCGG